MNVGAILCINGCLRFYYTMRWLCSLWHFGRDTASLVEAILKFGKVVQTSGTGGWFMPGSLITIFGSITVLCHQFLGWSNPYGKRLCDRFDGGGIPYSLPHLSSTITQGSSYGDCEWTNLMNEFLCVCTISYLPWCGCMFTILSPMNISAALTTFYVNINANCYPPFPFTSGTILK